MKKLPSKFTRTGLNLGPKGLFILISLIVLALTVATSIVKIASFTGALNSPEKDIALFTAIILSCALGQYLILKFVRTINKEKIMKKRLGISRVQKWISIIQCN